MMALRISIIINVICFIIIGLLLFAETRKKKKETLRKCRSNGVMWLTKICAAETIEQIEVLKGLIEKDIQYFKTVLPVEKVNREFENIAEAIRLKMNQLK